MAEWIGIGKRARRCYGFDEIALVPGTQTVNPNEVDTTFEIAGKKFKIPILAAAMDGVVDGILTFGMQVVVKKVALQIKKWNTRLLKGRVSTKVTLITNEGVFMILPAFGQMALVVRVQR